MKKSNFGIAIAISMFIFAGCQKEAVQPEQVTDSFTETLRILNSGSSNDQARALDRPDSWADCYPFAGVVTRATFKPESDPFDELYVNNLGVGFMDGVALISESKPGDRDYNGGRWHMNLIKGDVDPQKYKDVCSVEDLDLADFMSMPNYFECPLLPRKKK